MTFSSTANTLFLFIASAVPTWRVYFEKHVTCHLPSLFNTLLSGCPRVVRFHTGIFAMQYVQTA